MKRQFPRHVADYGVCKYWEVGGACATESDGAGSVEGGPVLPLPLLDSRSAARSCVITWSPAGELSPRGEFVPSRTQMDPAPFNRSFITAAPEGGAGRGLVAVVGGGWGLPGFIFNLASRTRRHGVI